MPPMNTCPRCGRPSPTNVTFCASCGTTLSDTSSGKGWKFLLGAVALFAGLLWVSVLYTQQSSSPRLAGATQPQALLSPGSGPASGAAQAAQSTPPPILTLTSAQHLAEAKRALDDGYKSNKDAQKTKWGEVAAAKWHLKAITPSTPEYREAQELLKEVARRERQIDLARKQSEKDEYSDSTAEADAVDDEDDDSSSKASSAPSAPSSTPAYSSPSAPTATRQTPPAGTTGTGSTSSSDYYTNSRGVRVQRPTFSDNGPPAGATAQCGDGSYSFSQSRRGTCSHHGGVSRWL
jgi:hypothetical protein